MSKEIADYPGQVLFIPHGGGPMPLLGDPGHHEAAGNPELANTMSNLLGINGIDSYVDNQRGFDHGMFVPLTLMYPDADIPCVQISLVKGLDPKLHIQIGNALSELRDDNVLVVGSAFSFHNMNEFTRAGSQEPET